MTFLKYPCSYCNKVYTTVNAFKKHEDWCRIKPQRIKNVRTRWGLFPKLFSCRRCGKKYTSQYYALKHPLICGKTIICEKCGTRHKNKLIACKKIHQCRICHYIFKTKQGFMRHVVNRACEKQYVCNICGSIFNRKISFESHRRSCIGLKLSSCNKCPICRKSFSTRASMRRHYVDRICQSKVISKPPSDAVSNEKECPNCQGIYDKRQCQQELKCRQCNQVFKKKSGFIMHVKFCTGTRKPKQMNLKTSTEMFDKQAEDTTKKHECMRWYRETYQCPNCNKEYATRDRLIHHIRTRACVDLSCGKCGLRCRNKTHLTRHTNTCDGKSQSEKTKCFKCGRKFARKENLIKHIQRCDLQCKKCFKYFHNAVTLSIHQCCYREDATTYQCPKCSKTFSSKYSLKEHLIKNASNGKCHYKCKKCGKTFSKRLEYHQLYCKYPLSSKIQCPYCKKEFRSEHALVTHLKSEICRRNYICANCGKQCDDVKTLDNHVKDCKEIGDSSFFLPDKPRCYNCKCLFMSPEALEKHLDLQICFKKHYSEGCHHCKDSKPFFCKFCNKRFKCQFLRDRHFRQNEAQNLDGDTTRDANRCTPAKITYWCPYCSLSSGESVAIAEHIFLKHEIKPDGDIKELPYAKEVIQLPGGPVIDGIVPVNTCYLCKKRFYSARYSRIHSHECRGRINNTK